MPGSEADDRDLIAEYRAGSESAARELFDRHCDRLMRLARRRIGQRMTARVDPEDIIQSAFRTFFNRVKNDEFTFEGKDDLFKLLVRLTVRKVLHQVAYHQAAKRNPGREIVATNSEHDVLVDLCASGPTPDVELALIEEFERFMGKLAPLDRKVLEMKLDGYSTTEIAEAVGSYDRKIRRMLERIQQVATAGE
jgi:RNA polymerase sigma-70 factor, ECF subfamily